MASCVASPLDVVASVSGKLSSSASSSSSSGSSTSVTLRPNAAYYVMKATLPAIERALAPVGADPRAWVASLPRPARLPPPTRLLMMTSSASARTTAKGRDRNNGSNPRSSSTTMAAFCLSRHCAACDALCEPRRALCDRCCSSARAKQATAAVLLSRAASAERAAAALRLRCLECGGSGGENGQIVCSSFDCGVFFERAKAEASAAAAQQLAELGLRQLEQEDEDMES